MSRLRLVLALIVVAVVAAKDAVRNRVVFCSTPPSTDTCVTGLKFTEDHHIISAGGVWDNVSVVGPQSLYIWASRHGSSAPALDFLQGLNTANMVSSTQVGDIMPEKLNFALYGTIDFRLTPGSDEWFTCKEMRIGQGHFGLTNNWWIASPYCHRVPELEYFALECDCGITIMVSGDSYHFGVKSTIAPAPAPAPAPAVAQCTDAADTKYMCNNFDALQGQVQSCLISALGSSSRAEACLGKLGLSSDCSTCWVNMGKCTVSNCAFSCISPSSTGCKTCAQKYCFPDVLTCTKLTCEQLPGCNDQSAKNNLPGCSLTNATVVV